MSKMEPKRAKTGLEPGSNPGGSNPGSTPFFAYRRASFRKPQAPRFRPHRGKFGDNWVLEAIFYIGLMTGFIDPTMFESSDFGRVKRRELRQRSVLALGGSSVTRRQFRKVQNSAALNDAQGKIGRQMEQK